MRQIWFFVVFMSMSACVSSQHKLSDKILVYTQPLVVVDDEWQFKGTEHLDFSNTSAVHVKD